MKKPKAPKGWRVYKFNYKGESPDQYENDDTVIGLEEKHPKDTKLPCDVVLMARNTTSTRAEDNYFNVYRNSGEPLDSKIKSATEGIEYCIMVAEKYIETPIHKIPGAKEGYYESLSKLRRICAKRGITELIATPKGIIKIKHPHIKK